MENFKVDIKLIKKLRDNTGAGFLDIKEALTKAKNNYDKALQLLKESGISNVSKKNDRIAAEGLINIKVNKNISIMTELNCETDFVAKNKTFIELIENISTALLNSFNEIKKLYQKKVKVDVKKDIMLIENSNSELLGEIIKTYKIKTNTIEKSIINAAAIIGEKISLRRFVFIEKEDGQIFGSYIHSNNNIGVLLTINNGDENLAKDLSMQVAAMAPQFISRKDITKKVIDSEKKIASKLIENNFKDKPQNIKDKMLEGKLNKSFASITLEGQAFVKDPKMNISKLLNSNNSSVNIMSRFEVGEGIETSVIDFATEVANQINKKK